MSQLNLPPHLAQQAVQQSARRQVAMAVRLQLAQQIYADLVGMHYESAIEAAVKEADPFDTQPDDEPIEIHLRVNLSMPAGLAVAAADHFLLALGLLSEDELASLKEATNKSQQSAS